MAWTHLQTIDPSLVITHRFSVNTPALALLDQAAGNGFTSAFTYGIKAYKAR
ncbi:MAG: hypothetical protein R2932_58210 [Caldilineaceae bacterium]